MNIPLSPCVPENLVSRDGFSRPVSRQPAHLHTQAESGAYLRDSSRVPRRRPFMKLPYAIGSVPSLSGHAIAYRWRSLPRVRRHRVSKPLGSSERVLPWQITMDQLIFASLSHTHYWYAVGMLKVAAVVHNTLQRHRLYGFPVASISPENLHNFCCMVRPAAATAGGLVDLGKRAGENATHIKIFWRAHKTHNRHTLDNGKHKFAPISLKSTRVCLFRNNVVEYIAGER